MTNRRERITDPTVNEVAWAQVEAEPTFTIEVTLTSKELVALCEHVDRFIEENEKTAIDRDELGAMKALRDAWPYRWEEPLRFP